MFNHTTVDSKNIKKIDNCFVDANIKSNGEYLSTALGLDESFLKMYNSWYKIDNKLYYFKKYEIFNELFLSELIKEYKLKSVGYSLAYLKNELGIISENIKDKKYKYFDYDYFFEQNNSKIPRNLLSLEDYFINNFKNNDNKSLMNSFYRLTAFDWFSGQTDRSDTNIIFKIKGNNTSLASIIDSGSSMHHAKFHKRNLDVLYTTYYSSFDNLSFPYDEYVNDDHRYLFDLINNNYELYKYLCKSLDIDIYDILKKTAEKYKLFIPDIDKEEVIKYFDIKKRVLENTLKLTKKYK